MAKSDWLVESMPRMTMTLMTLKISEMMMKELGDSWVSARLVEVSGLNCLTL